MESRNRLSIAGFSVAASAMAFFAWLAAKVDHGDAIQFDSVIRNAVNAWAFPRLTFVMEGVSQLAAPSFLVPLGMLIVWRLTVKGRRLAAAIFFASAGGAEALDQALKFTFRRVRPEAFFGYTEPLGYSFPSGHSIVSCCFFGVAAAIFTSRMRSRAAKALTWAAAAALVSAIGFSRVYLGVHYPSDVLGGYAAGLVWMAVVRIGYVIWSRRHSAAAAHKGVAPKADSTR